MFAHIFKARQKGFWELIISRSAAVSYDQVISSNLYASKAEAKKTARILGAIPHNY
jgi:hypothetical protein